MVDEERLRAITVGERRAHDAPIVLAESCAEWPSMYQLEAERVRAVLAARALVLEHVGSTDRMLAFRDWLRGHRADRELYERTKRDLAKRTWKYVTDHADAKTDVVQAILARALAGRP